MTDPTTRIPSAVRFVGSALVRFSGALVCTLAVLLAPPSVAKEEAPCGPFEAGPTGIVELAADRTVRDPGIQAPTSDGAAHDPGSIVPLPGAAPGTASDEPADSEATAGDAAATGRASEALLALPKNAAGAIPTDFELGPGAAIAQSFFSPVICATVARVTGPPGSTLDQLVTVVPDTGIVVPNDVYASAADELTPVAASPAAADPYAPLQYGLALAGVRDARSLGAGEGVRVALLDSAPEFAHRDLAPSRILAVATDEKSKAGVHGTLMAGVIGAAENNGYGIAGLAPKARIVSIPVCTPKGGAGGQCTIYQMLQGFDRAFDAEAVIVNLSLSGPPNPLLERGVARLEELGLVVVAAAGNEGREDRRYPAAYPSVVGRRGDRSRREALPLEQSGILGRALRARRRGAVDGARQRVRLRERDESRRGPRDGLARRPDRDHGRRETRPQRALPGRERALRAGATDPAPGLRGPVPRRPRLRSGEGPAGLARRALALGELRRAGRLGEPGILGAQRPEAPQHAHLDRGLALAAALADLLVREPLDHPQHDAVPRARVEGGEGRREGLAQERIARRRGRGRAQRVGFEGVVAAQARGATAELDAAGVQGHDRQPVAEGAVGGEAVEEAVDVGEDVLDDVLGLGVVAEDARGAAAQACAMACDEPIEAAGGIGAAGLQAADELGIGVRGRGGRDCGHAGDDSLKGSPGAFPRAARRCPFFSCEGIGRADQGGVGADSAAGGTVGAAASAGVAPRSASRWRSARSTRPRSRCRRPSSATICHSRMASSRRPPSS
jgi:hypothetical protein